MATVSEKLRLTPQEKIQNAFKADRVKHRVIFTPKKASPGETLYVSVPKLDDGVVLVSSSLALIFNFVVTSHANNFIVNKVSRPLVSQLVVKFALEKLQDTNAYDIYKLYEDLFLLKAQRANMFLEEKQSEDLNNIRSNAGDTSPQASTKKRNSVPKLDDGVVLVSSSLALIFNFVVTSHANNFIVNKVSRPLVSQLVVKFALEKLQDTNAYDIYKLYEDLFLLKAQRANMFFEEKQSEDLNNIR